MDAGRPRDLPGCLRNPVVEVDRPTKIEQAHEQHDEYGQREGEFDKRFAVLDGGGSGSITTPRPAGCRWRCWCRWSW